jgi:Flp pilus assembly pilin Flp
MRINWSGDKNNLRPFSQRKTKMRKMFRNRKGQGLVEYGLIISIAIGVIAVATSVVGSLGLTLPWVIAGGIAGLCVGYLLFCFARLGGGDAKLQHWDCWSARLV